MDTFAAVGLRMDMPRATPLFYHPLPRSFKKVLQLLDGQHPRLQNSGLRIASLGTGDPQKAMKKH
jgi:hypothetical protein